MGFCINKLVIFRLMFARKKSLLVEPDILITLALVNHTQKRNCDTPSNGMKAQSV